MILGNEKNKFLIIVETIVITSFLLVNISTNYNIADNISNILNIPFNISFSYLSFGFGYNIMFLLLILEMIFIILVCEYLIPKICYKIVWR